jgi:hypothetical protein
MSDPRCDLPHKHGPVSCAVGEFHLEHGLSLTLPLVTDSGDIKRNYTFFTLFRVARYWSKGVLLQVPSSYNM